MTTNSRKVRTFLARMALEEEQIRERIRQARKEAGLTQEQLADLLHVHKRTVEEWERTYVPWNHISGIASATGKDEAWLLHGGSVADPSGVATLQRDVEELRARVDQQTDLLLGIQELLLSRQGRDAG